MRELEERKHVLDRLALTCDKAHFSVLHPISLFRWTNLFITVFCIAIIRASTSLAANRYVYYDQILLYIPVIYISKNTLCYTIILIYQFIFMIGLHSGHTTRNWSRYEKNHTGDGHTKSEDSPRKQLVRFGSCWCLFREAKFLLLSNFIDFQVVYKPRCCNKVAHLGSMMEPSAVMVWHELVPTVMSMVTSDLAAPSV